MTSTSHPSTDGPRLDAACRVHIGFVVRDLAASIAFYEELLGVPPSKVRHDYAKFEPVEPALNLSLRVGAPHASRAQAGSHFGLQVGSSEAVAEAGRRLAAAGLATRLEQGVVCCHARQDKVWVVDPDENPWEVFYFVEDVESGSAAAGDASACCPESRAPAGSACC